MSGEHTVSFMPQTKEMQLKIESALPTHNSLQVHSHAAVDGHSDERGTLLVTADTVMVLTAPAHDTLLL